MRSRNVKVSIVLDEALVKACQKATGIKIRQELINYALHELLFSLGENSSENRAKVQSLGSFDCQFGQNMR